MGATVDPSTLSGAGDLSNMTTAEQSEALARAFYSQDKGYYLGPFLLGMTFDVLFCGVTVTQFIRWVGNNHPDRKFTRIIVYLTFCTSTAYTVFIIIYSMRVWVFNFGSYAPIADLTWQQVTQLGETVVALSTQVFYIDRAYRLLGRQRNVLRNVFVALVATALTISLGGCLAGTVFINTKIKTFFDLHKVEPMVYIWIGGQFSADIMITSITAWHLWKAKTGWATTDRMIIRLLRFTVETQLSPTIVALAAMVSFSTRPQDTLMLFFCWALCKPYPVGLLAFINDRNEMRAGQDNSNNTDINTYQLKSRRGNPQIHVLTETYTFTDGPAANEAQMGMKRQESDDFDDKDSSEFKTYLGDSRTHLTKA